MRFRSRQSIVQDFDGSAALGASISCPIPSTYPVEQLDVIVPITVGGTGTNTVAGNCLLDMITNVSLDVADGSAGNRSIFSGSAASYIIEDAVRMGRMNPRNTSARGSTTIANAAYNVVIPLAAVLRNIADPAKWNTLMPFQSYGDDPLLRLTFAATVATAIDNANATLTFGTPRVVVHQREVNIPGFRYFRFDAVEQVNTLAAGIIETKLPEFGVYTSLLARGFVSGSQAVVCTTGGQVELIRVADGIFRQREDDLIAETANGRDFTAFAGAWYKDFVSELTADGFSLNSAIDANLGSARVKLRQNVNAAATQRILVRRLLDDVSSWVAR
jgi:hypothetical protein